MCDECRIEQTSLRYEFREELSHRIPKPILAFVEVGKEAGMSCYLGKKMGTFYFSASAWSNLIDQHAARIIRRPLRACCSPYPIEVWAAVGMALVFVPVRSSNETSDDPSKPTHYFSGMGTDGSSTACVQQGPSDAAEQVK